MSISILDTDTLTLLQWDRLEIVGRFLEAPPNDVGVTIISVQEQFTGWLAAVNRVKNDQDLAFAYQRLTDNVRLLSGMRIFTYSEAAIRRYHTLQAMKLNVRQDGLADCRDRSGRKRSRHHAEPARFPARSRLEVRELGGLKENLWPTYRQLLEERILILDGAMGTMIQRHKFEEPDYRAERFQDHPIDLKNNNEALMLVRPDVIEDIHRAYLDAGADIIETNTFNANRVSMADFGMEDLVVEMNLTAARSPAAPPMPYSTPDKPRFVAGALRAADAQRDGDGGPGPPGAAQCDV